MDAEEGTQKDCKRVARRVARRLEGSQTSPRRYKLRGASSGRPLCGLAALLLSSRRLPGTSRRAAVLGPLYPHNRIEPMGKTLR
jgi:hypothetical protein